MAELKSDLPPLRVAYVVEPTFPRISETFILDQIIGLLRQGCQVDVYAEAPEPGDAPEHPGTMEYGIRDRTCYLHRDLPASRPRRLVRALGMLARTLPAYPRPLLGALNVFRYGREAASLRLLFETLRLVESPPYDVVHCHFGNNGLRALRWQELGCLSGPLVVTFHGYDLSWVVGRYGRDVYDELFIRGALFLPISRRWASTLVDLGCPPDRIQVHHMGIDCDAFAFHPRQRQEDDPPRVISVCRLVEKKGIEFAVRAVARLRTKHPGIRYTVVGDGPLRGELERLSEALHVRECIDMVGWEARDRVVERLRAAHLLLAPSVSSASGNQEGIPVAIMEAMAMGLPVLSTRHSGIPELVDDGVSGYLVEERDVDALADRLDRLIRESARWPAMGQAGRAKVEAEFNNRVLNRRLHDHFRQLSG